MTENMKRMCLYFSTFHILQYSNTQTHTHKTQKLRPAETHEKSYTRKCNRVLVRIPGKYPYVYSKYSVLVPTTSTNNVQ